MRRSVIFASRSLGFAGAKHDDWAERRQIIMRFIDYVAELVCLPGSLEDDPSGQKMSQQIPGPTQAHDMPSKGAPRPHADMEKKSLLTEQKPRLVSADHGLVPRALRQHMTVQACRLPV